MQLLGVTGLKQILGLIGCLQSEHMLFLSVVVGHGGQCVMYAYRIVQIVRHLGIKTNLVMSRDYNILYKIFSHKYYTYFYCDKTLI